VKTLTLGTSHASVIFFWQCSRKRVQQLKKRKKSCFWILKKKRKKRTYSLTGH